VDHSHERRTDDRPSHAPADLGAGPNRNALEATKMKSAVSPSVDARPANDPWRDFAPGKWKTHVDVRDFIQKNYTPYEGDETFLAGATERTKKLWDKLKPLFEEERKKGVLAVSQVPTGIVAHAPGYIDKASEIIVGLQTDAPLKRAIMPLGGWRVVEA